MNEQLPSPTPATILNDGPAWLTLPFALIALGVIFAIYILWWGTRLAMRRRRAREELQERGEAHFPGDPLPAPSAAPTPPPVAEAPLPTMPPAPPEPEAAPVPEPAITDEPIAAAAPLDASPASLAADVPSPPPADAGDDLTQMKGVGPKLVERLNALGITRFAQIAALTQDQAEALDAQLGNFQGRMARDRWIEQARFLAANDIAGYETVFGKL